MSLLPTSTESQECCHHRFRKAVASGLSSASATTRLEALTLHCTVRLLPLARKPCHWIQAPPPMLHSMHLGLPLP